MADTTNDNHQKLTELISKTHTGLFTTIDSDGHLVSRPMALQTVEFDGDLWFFTNASSDKVSELQANPAVNVAFQSSSSWVSVAGDAEVIDDREKAKELWNPFVKAYFPDGPEDPELRLIKVHADTAEYWDTDGKLISLFKMVKGAATSTVPDHGENKTIDL